MQKILFATDGSEASVKAGRRVCEFLDAWPDCQLTVLYVIQPVTYSLDTMIVPPELEIRQEQDIDLIRAQLTDRLFNRYEDRMRFEVRHGLPADIICGVAEEEQVDLIVVGSHGKGALQRVMLGSVSQAVVRRATAPVLVVRDAFHQPTEAQLA